MHNPPVSAIAAIDSKRGIAKDGQLPWRIPEDSKFFRTKTTGHVVIMGRKTYDSMGKALPNRTNIVITRDLNYHRDDAIVVHTKEEALRIAQEKEPEEIFIVGGAQIYSDFLPDTDILYLTLIDHDFNCDTFFPDYPEFIKVKNREEKELNGLKYTFITLTR